MLTPEKYLQQLKEIFLELGNPEIALQQSKYMKNKFDFYGFKTPIRKEAIRIFFRKEGLFIEDNLIKFIELSFEDEYRDIQYTAFSMVERVIKKQKEEFIETLEYMILHKSWWDTVDGIAKLVGIHFNRYPHLIIPVTEKWMNSDIFWLQRVSIIFQLFYKNDTDTDLLFRYILRVVDSKEFFLQKACGWALRQHSKTDPKIVINFVNNHKLSNLTRREALRLLT